MSALHFLCEGEADYTFLVFCIIPTAPNMLVWRVSLTVSMPTISSPALWAVRTPSLLGSVSSLVKIFFLHPY